jgi:hypothetical protein
MSNNKKLSKQEVFLRTRGLVAAVALLALLALGACSHVPVATLVKMRKFDPLTMDASALRVAVQADERIEPQPGGARITLLVWFNGEKDKGATHDFVLEEAGGEMEQARLKGFEKPGRRMHAFRLSPADAMRLRSIQDDARSRAPATRNNGVTLNVSVKSCHRGDLPSGPLHTDTYIRTDLGPDYLLFLSNVDLREAAAKAGVDFDKAVPPCG